MLSVLYSAAKFYIKYTSIKCKIKFTNFQIIFFRVHKKVVINVHYTTLYYVRKI